MAQSSGTQFITYTHEMKHEINPADLNISVSKIVPKRDGSALIKCDKQDNIKCLETNLQTNFGSEYEVIVPKKINPKVIIFNVSNDDLSDKEILPSNILKQNNIQQTQDSTFKLVRTINKNTGVNIVMECDSETFKSIIDRKKLYIGWRRCGVLESFHVLRCYNCCRYGHIAKDCLSPTTSPKCSENHASKDCTVTTHKCINCERSNERYHTKFSTDHYVFSNNCTVYKNKIQHLQNITQYEKI